jgi:peptide/nickel transport system substrate-binding protein
LAVAAACALPAQPSASPEGGAAPSVRGATRVTRITAGIRAELPTLSKTLNTIIPGATGLDRLVSAGLTAVDDQGTAHPQLAEAVPSLDNGLWKVFPDGRMETAWRLKPITRWHDGTPLTVDDLAFAVRVGQDRELPLFNSPAYASLDRVESSDPSTVTVFWKQPFIDADRMFGKGPNDDLAVPLPRHLLERVYLEEKATFTEHPHWTTEFVGAGPFKLREWLKGSSVTLVANDQYVLGRPKIDQIEVKFIADGGTLLANLLAGSVDLTIGERQFSLDEVSQVVDRFYTTIPWPDRIDALRQIIRHATDELLVMGMFYSTEANMVSNRVENALPTRAWNVQQWTVK